MATTGQERALVMGGFGILTGTHADAAELLNPVPFKMTLRRMKATLATPPSGPVKIQLRQSADHGASYQDVAGWTVTFGSGDRLASSNPADIVVTENTILNYTVSSGSGGGLLVEVVGVKAA